MKEERSSLRYSNSTAVPVFLLLVCGVCAYFTSFGGVMLFDDVDGIVKNPALRAHTLMAALDGSPLDSTPHGRPLVLATLLLNYRLDGIDVAGYHALNLAIHLANGLILFYLALKLLTTGGGVSLAGKTELWTAWCIALLWVLHPLNTAAVTYIVQRAESLMTLCYLGALALWTRGAMSGEKGRAWFLASGALCGMGMLAKESMATAPLVIVLFDAVFFSSGWREAWRRRWREYGVLAVAWIPLLLCMMKWPREHSTGVTETLGAWDYLLMQSEVVWHYLRLAVWPVNLALDYAWPPPASFAQVWIPFTALALVVAALVAGVTRRSKTALLGLFGFIVLAPTSSIVPIHTSVAAEHRMYLPLAGWIALLVVGARVVWQLCQTRRAEVFRYMVPVLLVLLAVFWGVLTWRRNLDYGSAVTIWSKVTTQQPGNYRALNNLASAYLDAGRPDEARAALVRALAVKPDYTEALFNLGTICGQAGQLDAAEDYLSRALRVSPNDADIHCNLANVYMARGNNPAAILSLERALKNNPAHLQSRFNLAVLRLQQGDLSQAEKHLGAVLAVDPAYPKWELLDAAIKAARDRAGVR